MIPVRSSLLVLFLATLVPAGQALAFSVLGEHNWDSGPEGWTNTTGATTLIDGQTPGGNPGGWLQIDFAATTQDPPGDEYWDVIYTEAENLFAGAWRTDMWVEFDFWAETTIPGALQLRWQSDTNTNYWSFALTPPAMTSQWTHYEAPLRSWNDWSYPGASEDQYLSDLATIDWIGVYIFRGSADAQTYGIDNFRLTIPEPAEYTMLGAAMLTSGLALRRRKRKKAPPETG